MQNYSEYLTTQGELIEKLRYLSDQHIKKAIDDHLFEEVVAKYLKMYRTWIFCGPPEADEMALKPIVYKKLGKKRMLHINIVVKKLLGYEKSENEKDNLKYSKIAV